MRIPHLVAVICLSTLGAGILGRQVQAMTGNTAAQPQAAVVVEGTEGIQTWNRLVELGGLERFSELARTIFVPSDAAFKALPADELSKLLASGQVGERRAFLARSATSVRIAPLDVAGKRVSVVTLHGRFLTIDATNGEIVVGDSEAIEVRVLPNGGVMYVLDEALTK